MQEKGRKQRGRRLFYAKCLAMVWICFGCAFFAGASPEESALDVIHRVTAGTQHVGKIDLKIQPERRNKTNHPYYTYQGSNGVLILRASDPVAACRGFYDYLRANGMGVFDWTGAHFRIPPKWPDTPKTQVVSPFRFNQMYNVVTAGYSFPYWSWERWEIELDWLALHGYNMFMAPIATEAIAERVWKKLGLTQEEIDDFTCGPAHAPWSRMGNIKHVDGPLPAEWNADQIRLQHKILTRARALGMTPIIQGFAGFVPDGLKRLYPDETYCLSVWNNAFLDGRTPVHILPESPLFSRIERLYVEEWKKEFGPFKYILIDTYNEAKNLPLKKDETIETFMANYGQTVSSVLANIDPHLVWTFQGWVFHYQRKIWTPSVVKALMSSIPPEKILVLDMMGEWNHLDGFSGQPWMLGKIVNMGGKTPWNGRIENYKGEIKQLLQAPASVRKNNVGNSDHSEGIEVNVAVFEYNADLGWFGTLDTDAWLDRYIRNRYGKTTPQMRNIWHGIKTYCLTQRGWNVAYGWQRGKFKANPVYPPEFFRLAQQFLAQRKAFADSSLYRADALEISAMVLCQKADESFAAAAQALDEKQLDAAQMHFDRAIKLLQIADQLLQSHPIDRLDRWIAFAREHSTDPKLQDYYEENARRIITVWGPPVNDYSCRMWSGLIRDFYIPRMRGVFENKAEIRSFDRKKWEEQWVHSTGVSPCPPFSDPLEAAAQALDQALAEKISSSIATPRLSAEKD